MIRNRSGQKIVLVVTAPDGTPQAGDAGNLVAYVSKDGVAPVALGGTPTELDATNATGVYSWDLTTAETDADMLVFTGVSSTTEVLVTPVIIFTMVDAGAAGSGVTVVQEVDVFP